MTSRKQLEYFSAMRIFRRSDPLGMWCMVHPELIDFLGAYLEL
jgi:hypothetical protein